LLRFSGRRARDALATLSGMKLKLLLWSERRAVPELARAPSGHRPTYSSAEGLT
jgi:hypothetical protein